MLDDACNTLTANAKYAVAFPSADGPRPGQDTSSHHSATSATLAPMCKYLLYGDSGGAIGSAQNTLARRCQPPCVLGSGRPPSCPTLPLPLHPHFPRGQPECPQGEHKQLLGARSASQNARARGGELRVRGGRVRARKGWV